MGYFTITRSGHVAPSDELITGDGVASREALRTVTGMSFQSEVAAIIFDVGLLFSTFLRSVLRPRAALSDDSPLSITILVHRKKHELRPDFVGGVGGAALHGRFLEVQLFGEKR